MTGGMLRQAIQCKQKKWRWSTQNSPFANSANGTARRLKQKKIVFRVRKDYLRKFFFLITMKNLCFQQVNKYTRLRKQQLANFRVHMKQF